MLSITDATFNTTVLRASGPVLVDYWADWCSPCKKLTPILEELDPEYPDIQFVSLNIDENSRTAVKYGVLGLPTIHIFVDGEIVESFQGGRSRSSLISTLDKYKKKE